jgi:hypothetical protein
VLWLDDNRSPNYHIIELGDAKYVTDWCKNFDDFKKSVLCKIPDIIYFDHDLGEEKTGYDCAWWLVNYCIDHDIKLPAFEIHSKNPVGKENIERLLNNYIRHMET